MIFTFEQLSEQKFEQSEIFSYLNKELVQKSRCFLEIEQGLYFC